MNFVSNPLLCIYEIYFSVLCFHSEIKDNYESKSKVKSKYCEVEISYLCHARSFCYIPFVCVYTLTVTVLQHVMQSINITRKTGEH